MVTELTAESLCDIETVGRLQHEAQDNGYGCLGCKFTGYVTAFGEVVACACQSKAKLDKKSGKKVGGPTKVDIASAIAGGDVAVANNVIPKWRKDDSFDVDVARQRIMENAKNSSALQATNVDGYLNTLVGILNAISTNSLDRSYVIGAPAGCSKTTFVVTALKRLSNAGKRVVPYMSLTELAELHRNHVAYLVDKTKREQEKFSGGVDISNVSWKQVLEADVLFTYLTDYDAAQAELSVLKTILTARGLYNRPTIVMTTNSVAGYDRKLALKALYWSDIQLYDESQVTTKKLLHVSTWNKYPVQGNATRPGASMIQARRGEDF